MYAKVGDLVRNTRSSSEVYKNHVDNDLSVFLAYFRSSELGIVIDTYKTRFARIMTTDGTVGWVILYELEVV